MRTRHIEVFHAVYTYGSVTKASEMLNVSQPSVSKVLSHAESQLGYKLFKRSGGRMVPTMEAEKLYEHVGRLFDEITSVRRVANNLRNIGDGKIRLAATHALGMTLIPEFVATFIEMHPGTYFELETLHFEEIVTALRESRIDLAVAFDPPKLPDLEIRAIAEGEFVLIKPSDMKLAAKAPIDLAALKNVPLIRLNNRGPLGQLLDAYLESSDTAFNIVAATETYHIAYGLVARGVGVSIVDEVTARSYGSANVDVIPLKVPLKFDICAVQRANAGTSQTATQFLEHAEQIASDLIST